MSSSSSSSSFSSAALFVGVILVKADVGDARLLTVAEIPTGTSAFTELDDDDDANVLLSTDGIPFGTAAFIELDDDDDDDDEPLVS